MILTALNQFYERKSLDPASGISPLGYSEENLGFALLISREGELKATIDLRDTSGKKPKPKRLIVPAAVKRTVGITSNFLWDNTGYVLGADSKGKPERTRDTHLNFKSFHEHLLSVCDDDGARALLAFLEGWKPEEAPGLGNWDEACDANLIFRLEGDDCYLHERPALRALWCRHFTGSGEQRAETGQCLVTGEKGHIAKLHSSIKGVSGAQSSGASLVSFNLASFTSYGKEQNLNAPVGEMAAFGYTTALNWLLRSENKRSLRMGDATVIFWAERDTPAENLLAAFLDPPLPEKEKEGKTVVDDKTSALVGALLKNAGSGGYIGEVEPSLEPGVRFYILGLSPNASRLALRYWQVSTFGEIIQRIARHYEDLAIEKSQANLPDNPPPWLLLLQTATQGKADNIPPLLGGALMRAILTGERYPQTLFTGVLGRIRADREINYYRASIIKAVLTRNHEKEISMSLDEHRTEPGYRLGRLFALLEKVQQDATHAKAGIRERCFGAASATPRAIFPQLMRTAQHHLSKAEYGGHVDRLIQSVMEGVGSFPAHLSLEEQGLFSIGYYHQKNALYRKKEED